MPPSFFPIAAEVTMPRDNVQDLLPWAADNHAWSGPSPKDADRYGTLLAFPGGVAGSFCLFHDRAQRHFGLALYGLSAPPKAVTLYSRRFRVVLAEGYPRDAA